MEKKITYCGQPAKVACDENCEKAFGENTRPKIYLDDPTGKIYGLNGEGTLFPDDENTDADNWAWLSDDELGIAPDDPGTQEGRDSKPLNKFEIPNKWCVRECERCVMSRPGKINEPLVLPDFSKRLYNIKRNDPEIIKQQN